MTSKGNAALRGVSSTTTWTLHVQQKARIAEKNLLSPPSAAFLHGGAAVVVIIVSPGLY